MDFDQGGQSFAAAEGNGYSAPVQFDLSSSTVPTLHIDRVYHERPFKETDHIKLVDIESKLLSSFHRRNIHMRAGVVLPKDFSLDTSKKYPVIYSIPGFGGSHHSV